MIMMVMPSFVFGQGQIPLDYEFALGSPPLSVRLPAIPQPMETRIQPSLLEIMMAYYAYIFEDSVKGITVMLLQTTYAQHIHPDMTIISDQTIRDLESRGSLSIKYKTKSIDIEGRKGIRQEGTLMSNGDHLDFTSTILQEGPYVWKVIIYARTGDTEASQTVQAVMNSITFKQQ